MSIKNNRSFSNINSNNNYDNNSDIKDNHKNGGDKGSIHIPYHNNDITENKSWRY